MRRDLLAGAPVESSMKTGARALRRHHLARIKHRWHAAVASRSMAGKPADAVRVAGLRAATGTPCSCWMCGNPRKYFGEASLQERRWRLSVVEHESHQHVHLVLDNLAL